MWFSYKNLDFNKKYSFIITENKKMNEHLRKKLDKVIKEFEEQGFVFGDFCADYEEHKITINAITKEEYTKRYLAIKSIIDEYKRETGDGELIHINGTVSLSKDNDKEN